MKKSGLFFIALITSLFSATSSVPGQSNNPRQSNEPPIEDKRLTIHTLIREDIFSGWRSNNAKRLKRGEENIEKLLKSRPESKAELLAWKGGVALYHAVVANDNDQQEVYQKQLVKARELFAQAKKENPNSGGVHSVIGGSNTLFGDRLSPKDKKQAWEQAYASYQFLWKNQGPKIESMPLHIGGELLAGLVQSAQRLGKDKEVTTHLDKIIDVYGGSAYAKEAKLWKADPKVAESRKMVCKSCHSAGRLKAKLKKLDAE